MSELFAKNLELIAKFQPNTAKMIADFGPVLNQKLTKLEEPVCPPCYQLFVAGIDTLPKLHPETLSITMFEPDLQMAAWMCTEHDLAGWVGNRKFYILITNNYEKIQHYFYNYYKNDVENMVRSELNRIFCSRSMEEYGNKMREAYSVGLAMAQVGYRSSYDHVLEGVAGYLNNTKYDYKDYSDYKNTEEGLPAVICSAGPSLRDAVPILKELQKDHQFVTIALNSCFNYLDQEGVRVDYMHILDRSKDINHYFPDEPRQTTQLVGQPWVQPYISKKFKDNLVWLPSRYRIQQQAFGLFGEWETDTFVSHQACRWAEFLGCQEIWLVGQDLGKKKDQQDYAGGFDIEEALRINPKKTNYITLKNKFGEDWEMIPEFLEQAKALSTMCTVSKVKYVNASPGYAIGGCIDLELKDFNPPKGQYKAFTSAAVKTPPKDLDYASYLRKYISEFNLIIQNRNIGKKEKKFMNLVNNNVLMQDVLYSYCAWEWIKYNRILNRHRLYPKKFKDKQLVQPMQNLFIYMRNLLEDILARITGDGEHETKKSQAIK